MSWIGDAKLAGRGVEVREVTVIRVGDPPDHLVIETWRDGRGISRVERA